MIIEKLRKRKNENIISSVEKSEYFLFFLATTFFTSLSLFSFYQIKKPNTYLPTSFFLSGKKKKVFSKVDNLYLSSTITIFL
jgi:hypothetical protein